jgi:hypothetical protein
VELAGREGTWLSADGDLRVCRVGSDVSPEPWRCVVEVCFAVLPLPRSGWVRRRDEVWVAEVLVGDCWRHAGRARAVDEERMAGDLAGAVRLVAWPSTADDSSSGLARSEGEPTNRVPSTWLVLVDANNTDEDGRRRLFISSCDVVVDGDGDGCCCL